MSKRRKYGYSELPEIPEPSTPYTDTEPSAMSPEPSPVQPSRPSGPASGTMLPLRICGSMFIAVPLMTLLLVALAWGTFVESEYGTAVAKFALYDSFWFTLLHFLLAGNILCSLLVRFPWKRAQYPFVAVHSGILILLVGCFLTWSSGEEAQITIHEGAAGNYAMKRDRLYFEVRPISHSTPSDARNTKNSFDVPFEPGPFNWSDYNRDKWFHSDDRRLRDSLWLAMQWGRRDTGRLTLPATASGIQIEVLDYYASSTTEPVAPMELSVLWKKPLQTPNELGDVRETPRTWESVKFDARRMPHPGPIESRGVQKQTAGGERINFYMTDSPAEVAAFRASAPDPSRKIGIWGQLILHQAQKNYYFDVDQLLDEAQDNKRVPLGDSGFSVGNARLQSRGPGLRLTIFAPNGENENIVVFADLPDWNVPARQFGVFGTYWLDPEGPMKKDPGRTEPAVLDRMTKPRLDILQGPGRTLYYRFWTGRSLASSGEILMGSSAIGKPNFTIAQGTPDEAEFVIDRFFPQDLPGQRIVPLPVGKQRGTHQRVKLRVNVDGNEDVFWIRAAYPSLVPLPPERDQVRYVYGKDRTVRIVWNYDRIDLGFGIFLKRFEKRSEPGSRMSAHYSSLIDFVQLNDSVEGKGGYTTSPSDFRVLRENVLIRMNQPAVFQSSALSRRYRIYQSSFDGPYHPNDTRFLDLYDGNVFPWETKPRESLYMSTLSINDDPGRGMKYLGCFLIAFGSLWVLYRKS